MKAEFFDVNFYGDNNWLRKNLEDRSKHLSGQTYWRLLHFQTHEAADNFVRDVFAGYCDNVTNPKRDKNLDGVTYTYRYTPDGATVKFEDGVWTLIRRIQCKTIREVRTRKEVVVDGETYSRDLVEEIHTEWADVEYSDMVTLLRETHIFYLV